MKLPSRGWGPWREEFYSIFSNSQAIEADTNHEHGLWHNVWLGKAGHFIYGRWPDLWRWWVNLPPFHRCMTRRLNKFFPNLH